MRMDGSDPTYAIQEARKIAHTSDTIREMDNTTMPGGADRRTMQGPLPIGGSPAELVRRSVRHPSAQKGTGRIVPKTAIQLTL